MSPLSQKIAAALEQTTAPGPFRVEEGTAGLELILSSQGSVGLAFDTLTYRDTQLAGLSNENLKNWAERLASRVTYLMEPLVLVELDPNAGEAELRSQVPTARGDLRSFYEARLNSREGTLKLSRVVFDEATRRRRPAGCLVTIEVLERLTDDLVSTSR